MKKRKTFIFTNKRNSNRAVMAVVLGTISLAAVGTVVFLAYRGRGEAFLGRCGGYGIHAGRYAFAGLLSAFYSLVGLALGFATMFDKKYFKLFPVLGVLLNGAALVCVGLIFYLGLPG